MQRAVKTNPLVVDSMEASNQPDHPFRSNEEERDSSSSGDSDLSDSSDLDCDSDAADPSFRVLDEANHKLSALSIRKKPQSRIGKDHGEEGDDGVFEIADDMIKAGQVEKLKIDQCKTYLRKQGLRLSGCKAMLIQRIKEHQEILDGRGEAKYPLSSFVINCKGDACTSDIVLFEQNVYDMYNIASRSASGPPCGKRIVAGRIVKESYGAAKQQHTFTIEVLWSKGEKPLPPLHPLLIKGRNLYRLKTLRQRWQDENQRSRVLLEKHSRGSLARSDRETRMLEKEKRKLLCKGRVSRKDPKRKHVDTIHSTEPAKTDSLLVQQPSIAVNSQTMATQGKQYGKGTNEDPSTFAINMEVRIQNPKIPHPSSGQLNGNGTIMGQGGIHQKLPYYPQQDPIENRNSTFSLESRKMILQGGRPNNHAQKHESYYRGDQVPWELQPMRYGGNQQVQNFRRQPLTRMNNHGPARQPQSHGRQMCKYYAQGRCYFGNGCKFSHQRNEVQSFGQRREQQYGGSSMKDIARV